jgi:ferrous iron transport protein A
MGPQLIRCCESTFKFSDRTQSQKRTLRAGATRAAVIPLQGQIAQSGWNLRPLWSDMLYSRNEVNSRATSDSQLQLAFATMMPQGFEFVESSVQIRIQMQAVFTKRTRTKEHKVAGNLMELRRGEQGILDRIDLPEDDARRLMELGFLPGHTVTLAHSAPGGDPRVFRVDGTEIALRRETARKLILRLEGGL